MTVRECAATAAARMHTLLYIKQRENGGRGALGMRLYRIRFFEVYIVYNDLVI